MRILHHTSLMLAASATQSTMLENTLRGGRGALCESHLPFGRGRSLGIFILPAVDTSIHTAHVSNTEAFIHLSAGNVAAAQEWLIYTRICVEPGQKYFQNKFTNELSGTVAAFKGAQLFIPHKVDET